MKTMDYIRRFMAVLVAAVTLLTLVSCKKEITSSDAYANYVSAINSIRSADSFSGEIVLRSMTYIMDETYEYTSVTGIKHIFGSGDGFQAEIDATLSTANFKSYYKDGIFIYEGADDKFKFAMSGEEFLKMTNSVLVTEVLFQEASIFGMESTIESGKTALRFEVRSAGMEGVLNDLAKYSITGGVMDEHAEGEMEFAFDDLVVMMWLDKGGNLMDILITVVFMMTHFEDQTTNYIEIGIENIKVGGVAIDYPENLESFTDLDSDAE